MAFAFHRGTPRLCIFAATGMAFSRSSSGMVAVVATGSVACGLKIDSLPTGSNCTTVAIFRSLAAEEASDCGLIVEVSSACNNGEDESNGGTEWTSISDGILGGLSSP
ncbi:hypothetical protein ACFX13_036430 [Malus domestica]